MDTKDLLWFASGFRTVAFWRDAMSRHGYSVPTELCDGLSLAMQRLKLSFREAFCLLWTKKKIIVNGQALLYDPSAAELWEAPRPASAPIAWHRDVLALVPPTEDMLHLESLGCLTADSSPLMRLALWQPSDEDDEWFRQFLLDFGHDVAIAGD